VGLPVVQRPRLILSSTTFGLLALWLDNNTCYKSQRVMQIVANKLTANKRADTAREIDELMAIFLAGF